VRAGWLQPLISGLQIADVRSTRPGVEAVASVGGLPLASSLVQLKTGDKVQCEGYQSSGADRTLNGVADRNTLSIARLY
jgi:hypothetical protein